MIANPATTIEPRKEKRKAMDLQTLAKNAGYSVKQSIVPKKYYTITNLKTGLKTRMGSNRASLIQAFLGECKKKGHILQIEG